MQFKSLGNHLFLKTKFDFKYTLYKCIYLLSVVVSINNVNAATLLADKPLFSASNVPANVALALSVEFPTALGSAYYADRNNYQINKEYVGYWDSEKCYAYQAATRQNIQGPFNTGVSNSNVALAQGENDPHWVVISSPGNNITERDNANNVGTWGGSTGGDSDSAYIGTSTSAGQITYNSHTFNFPASTDPTKVSVEFDLWADDALVGISVNGVNTGITNSAISWNAPGHIAIPAGAFTSNNNNIITIVVNNTGGLGGMRIDNIKTYIADPDGSYFKPVSVVGASHACTDLWSGNFLNWALTQTIDPMRHSLSGGYRAVDKADMTVLEKAWATGQGGTVGEPTISNNMDLIKQSTPFTNLSTLKIKIAGLGNKFVFTSTGNVNSTPLSDTQVTSTPVEGNTYEMYARVKVCDPSLLEKNCERYPTGHFKPTGLIQKNAMKLNFAAFGYLLDDNLDRDGGVLRARMGPVGPKKPVGATEVVNGNAEWDEFSGVFNTNPHAADAASSGVANSGVINYLNKFGLTAKKYKTFDPVSELYYATTRYFKNLGNVASYTNNLDDTKKDGFPVITSWDDPIKQSCQANFIIGVGDTNTHADNNLPGSNIRTGKEPSIPSEVSADNTIDVSDATNKVSQLEGLPGLYANYGNIKKPFCCNDSGALMAGIAYDSHTKDIRSDIVGNQTITTYYLDVLESGDKKDVGGTGMWNQFWLAAKYGGFDVPENYDPYAATAGPLLAQWDKNDDGDPDNYFRANNPQLMIDGLNKAFDDILVKAAIGVADGFSVINPSVISGDIALGAGFDSDGWVGDVSGGSVSFDANDLPSVSKVWSAQSQLEAQASGLGWSTARSIATANCSSIYGDGTKNCTGVAFKSVGDLNSSDSQTLTKYGAPAQVVLDFLRGDRSNEVSSYNLRIRKKLLGDINNSKIVLVGAPNSPMTDGYNPGYSAFKTANSNRTPVAYIGANDGMLHAFNATLGSGGGNELFAYIPSMLFQGPNGTPEIDGLVALSKNPYEHHQYVDATPIVQDINFGGGASDWHTLLVGGLGKGGKGYYAIDVTNPYALTNESTLANAVKWEFTHNDMGYSFNKPIFVKVENSTHSGWFVIVTSGYNTPDKNGSFFIINPKTGALIKQVKTSGDGLSSPNVLINNAQSFTGDAVYAGDLEGNVWRLNLDDFTVTKLAELKNGGGQPITTRPRIAVDKATGDRYVLVGTGKLLDESDLPNTQVQSVYAIKDGNGSAGGYNNSALPINRSKLNNNSASYTTGGVTNPAANTFGWYLDMSNNYFINVEMQVNAGVLYVGANSVIGGTCGSDTSNRLYQFNFASGNSATGAAFQQASGMLRDITLFRNADKGLNAPVRVLKEVQNKDGTKSLELGQSSLPSHSFDFSLLNWRDLPTAD